MTRSLGFDAWGQIETKLHTDPGGGFTVSMEHDNAAFEDARGKLRNDGTNGFNQARDWRQISYLSMGEAMFLSQLWGVPVFSKKFDDKYLKLIQDSDWKKLKTVDGGVRTKASVR